VCKSGRKWEEVGGPGGHLLSGFTFQNFWKNILKIYTAVPTSPLFPHFSGIKFPLGSFRKLS